MTDPERIRDPIHGFIYLSKRELQIVDTAPFQRLRRIHQLALTHFVYPGAEHNRFAHSLGVMHLATQVFEAIEKHSPRFGALPEPLREHLKQVLRLYALLHDIGHAPFSHAGDDLFPDKTKHELYSAEIIQKTPIADIITEIGKDLRARFGDEYNITPELIASLMHPDKNPDKKKNHPEYFIIRQIMDSEADADKMDYLLRDSHYCGVSYGHYDLPRLLESFEGIEQPGPNEFRLGIAEGGLHAFEAFVLARYWMFQQVYFHRTRRIFDFYLQNHLKGTIKALPRDTDDFLRLDDYTVWKDMEEQKTQWASAIVARDIWPVAYESKPHASEGERVQFRLLKTYLRDHLGEDSSWHIDHAKKDPHKLSIEAEQEEAGLPLVLKGGGQTSLVGYSEVISKVTAPIKKYRVYARPDMFKKVEELCKAYEAEAEKD